VLEDVLLISTLPSPIVVQMCMHPLCTDVLPLREWYYTIPLGMCSIHHTHGAHHDVGYVDVYPWYVASCHRRLIPDVSTSWMSCYELVVLLLLTTSTL